MKFVRDIIGRDITIHTCECCEIANHSILPAGGRIFESDYAVVYSNLSVPFLGFIVIAPKKHIIDFDDLSEEEKTDVYNLGLAVSEALRGLGIAENFTMIQVKNPHARLWIMPHNEVFDQPSFDFQQLENTYSSERRKLPVSDTHDILLLNRKLKSIFEGNKKKRAACNG